MCVCVYVNFFGSIKNARWWRSFLIGGCERSRLKLELLRHILLSIAVLNHSVKKMQMSLILYINFITT